MRDYSRLPRELIDTVTDILYNDYDIDGLLACSLVCRSWLPSSQRLLFRQVAFPPDRGDSEELAQTLISSPHLADYVIELKVYWDEFWRWQREYYRVQVHGDIDQSFAAAVLRKLSKLQRIELYQLDWSILTVDLRQSLRWVLMLPSVTFLTLNITHHESDSVDFFQHPLTQEDEEENDDEPKPDLEPRHLSHLNLGLGFVGNCHAYVDWFLGPRSRFEVSHIQTLRVDHLREDDERGLNRLLRAIGSSLKHLELRVPLKGDMRLALPELGFDIKLEFTPNIRVLRLTNISIAVPLGEMYPESFGMNWLLRFLSNIDTSNKLEQIELKGLIGTEHEEACSPSGWGRVDCLLAGKFRKLQKLDIMLWSPWEDEIDRERYDDAYGEIAWCMFGAHPLLLERGVSVNVRCEFGEWWEVEEDMDLF
ncbi:hypothetical protein JB92DRAFT_3121338 [Gautieria morchelliformis]|nr:hypothetical protein JB92DRAFT_3121338 [Gautieria morchelliformis]